MDLQNELPGKSNCDLLKVKIGGGAESCILTQRAYRRMFPANHMNDSPKPMPFSQQDMSYYSPTQMPSYQYIAQLS